MFRPARKENVALKIAFFGPSGSGKTLAALKVATGLGGRVAMIDTENNGGGLYADLFSFDILQCDPPFAPESLIQALQAAEQAGYAVVILDSLSQVWSGSGGVLEQVDAARRIKDGYNPWAGPARRNERLIQYLLYSRCHILVTMRAKTQWLAAAGEEQLQGMHPIRRGLAPEQRQGIEYEFTTVFSLSPASPQAMRIKDRTGLFSAFETLSTTTGANLAAWLQNGVRAA